LSLFDLLNQQEYYNEKKVSTRGFNHDDKNLLCEKILEALHVFHSGKSIDSELSRLLHQISILYQKSLWDELAKRVKKARKLATNHERFLSLLEIIKWEKIIADRIGKYDKYNSFIEEQIAVRKKLNEELRYTELADRVGIILITDSGLHKSENQLQFEKLTSDVLLDKPPTSSSILAQICYHRIKFRYYLHIKKDKLQARFHIEEIIQLFEKYHFVLFIEGVIGTYLITLFWQKELSDTSNQIPDFVEIIDNLPLQSPHTIYAAYMFGLSDCQRNLKQQAGELIIQKMEVENYISKIALLQQLPLFYNIITFYGVFGEWEKAQKWLNKVLAIKRPAVRKDVQIRARFWWLIISYEQQSDELDKHIQSVQKYLRRANIDLDIQQHILQTFNTLDQTSHYKERKLIWEKLYSLLEEKSTHPINVNTPIRQLQLWCKSKINQTTIAEVMRS